ncbi:MAG: glycoside hydrolase family 43 protein [Sphingomonas sp.]|uniref:glycoside hydrolase family 43 protein n=1 Tax=Sphingomonas sp. TaxID=28214 RepID=UPI0022733A97|nr:glycoside hydrolase family 43 protein [Sphingomonas sp.]MCX8477470.1 glycoside hydrolase family 43 protein [Sphingomonas sp.]
MKCLLAASATALGLLLSPVSAAQTAPERPAKQLPVVATIAPTKGKPAAEKDRSAYLLVYFKDETHSLHFAVSSDGYSFTDVNGGEPVLLGRDIAEQKGVRDPHISRGPDGAFYLAMTDLHIFAQREGLRSTEWQRDGERYGWGNNRALIFMKSYDLVHWTHAAVRVDRLFPSTAEIGTAWAPQTLYDPAKRKMMVYYSTRDGKETDHMVYSYADDAFTTLTAPPVPLFKYPDPTKGTIDGDITRVGGKYHLFYVAHDKPGHLRQAVSGKINRDYAFDPTKIDPETVATEAPSLWRRHGTDTYVLMYDVFGAKPVNNMGFSETRDFVHFKNLGRFNEPGSPMKSTNFSQPKHGAVVSISPEEMRRLQAYFAR